MSHLRTTNLTLRGQLLGEISSPAGQDVVRLLMEPITYANGSTLEDPALTYGIVFSNFMSKGVYTFQGGSDRLIQLMHRKCKKTASIFASPAKRKRIARRGTENRGGHARISSARPSWPPRKWSTVILTALCGRNHRTPGIFPNLPVDAASAATRSSRTPICWARSFDWWAKSNSLTDFIEEARAVRLNNSSTQVYIASIRARPRRERCGDLFFVGRGNSAPRCPKPKDHKPHVLVPLSQDPARHAPLYVVASTTPITAIGPTRQFEYEAGKQELIESTLAPWADCA